MKVFISHSRTDKGFVRFLKECLLANNIETWLDEDQLDLGDSLMSKLQLALNESTHLLIILSPSSINSDWVQFELKKALVNTRTGLINKIIPIKYRDCKVPDELQDLIYADLSNEVVLPVENKIQFISDGFEDVFLKIVRAIKNSSKIIDKAEKEEIIKSVKSSEKEVQEFTKSVHRATYKLIGYNTLESRQKYQNLIAKKTGITNDLDSLRPILLPPAIRNNFEPKIGDIVKIIGRLQWEESFGHFAGFRDDDLSITLDKRTRIEIHEKSQSYITIEVDPYSQTIKIKDKLETDANEI